MTVHTAETVARGRHSSTAVAQYKQKGLWRNEALATKLEEWSTIQPGTVAVSDGDCQYTWLELKTNSDRFAVALQDLGVEPGDRVHVQLPNWSEFVIVYLALARIGAVLVPSMPIYRHEEIAYVLNHSEAKVSIVAGEFRQFDYPMMLAEIRDRCPTVRAVVAVRSDPRDGALSFADLLASVDEVDASRFGQLPDADATHAIIYTSGTESRPKGCEHTFNTLSFSAYGLGRDIMGLGPGDVMFMPSPVTHATGLVMGVTAPVMLGAAIHLMPVWDPVEALQRIAQFQCTASVTATPFVRMLLDARQNESADLSSLRVWVCAGAPIPESLLQEWRDTVPTTALLPLFGCSEGLIVTSCRFDDPPAKIISSDGRPLPQVRVEIRDEDGQVVPAGQEGEIWHGGPGLMLGYWRDPDLTDAQIDASAMKRSGDLGRIDAEGYLRVTGRIKDMIIRGGTNLSAREIEEHVLSHPKVRAVAVVGYPDVRLGEKACAFVVPSSHDDPPSLDQLTEYLRAERKIAVQKLPERLELADDLPTTATGKVQKFLLRQQVTAKLTDEAR